jgi:hypothetical protein
MGEYDGSSQFDGAPSQRLATSRIRLTRARGVSDICILGAVKNFSGVRHLVQFRSPCQWVVVSPVCLLASIWVWQLRGEMIFAVVETCFGVVS